MWPFAKKEPTKEKSLEIVWDDSITASDVMQILAITFAPYSNRLHVYRDPSTIPEHLQKFFKEYER